MIQSKADYHEYFRRDLVMTHISKVPFRRHLIDPRFKFYRSLRKTEYFINCRHDLLGRIYSKILLLKHKRLCNRLQWTIPPNVFGKGLAIVHSGTIVVSGKCAIGENCRLHVCVNIGDAIAKGKDGAPVVGDNVYIGPGVKIFGAIVIGDNVAIGANAVVNQSFEAGNCTIAGVPARVVSSNTSAKYITENE